MAAIFFHSEKYASEETKKRLAGTLTKKSTKTPTTITPTTTITTKKWFILKVFPENDSGPVKLMERMWKRYGNVGRIGQKLVTQCDTPRDARAFRKRQIAKKRQGGKFQNVKRTNKTPAVMILSPNTKKSYPTKSKPRPSKKIQTTKFGIKKEEQRKINDAVWYYYLENDLMGKKDGWYPFEDVNSEEIEGCHNSDSLKHLALCIIQSKTTGFRYLVDSRTMQQTNIKTGTTRPIRRKAKD